MALSPVHAQRLFFAGIKHEVTTETKESKHSQRLVLGAETLPVADTLIVAAAFADSRRSFSV